MSEKNRKLFIGKKVFIIDFLRSRNSTKTYVTSSVIVNISHKNSTIRTKLMDGTYQNYRIGDFGKMVFCTRKAAYNFWENLPKIGDYVFMISKSGKIISKDVTSINMHIRLDATLLLYFGLHTDNVDMPIYSINKDIFLTRSEALCELKKRNHVR